MTPQPDPLTGLLVLGGVVAVLAAVQAALAFCSLWGRIWRGATDDGRLIALAVLVADLGATLAGLVMWRLR